MVLALLMAGAVVAPFLSPFALSVLTLILVFAILAMSLDVLMGYTGMESLGQAAFFGMGAYTVGILAARYDVGWEVAVPLALIASVILAAIAGSVAVRLRGLFFLVITLAVAQVLWGLSHRWGEMTGGYLGLHGISRPLTVLRPNLNWYYVVLGGFVISAFLLYRLVQSPFGLTLRGIKDSELRMRTSGYNVWLHKYVVFVICGLVSGFAGVLYTYSTLFISPSVLEVRTSFEAMLMVIIGGAGTLAGPVIGAAVVIGLRNYLSVFLLHWIIALGMVFIITVHFAPNGILGLVRRRPRVARKREQKVEGGSGRMAPARPAERIPHMSSPMGSQHVEGTTVKRTKALQLEGVGKFFGSLRALHDVSLEAYLGSRMAILGPNGAGKTTLFNLITGVHAPSYGTISLLSTPITHLPAHARVRMGLARTYQITNLYPTLTALDNIRLGVMGTQRSKFMFHSQVASLDGVHDQAKALLEATGLWEERDTQVAHLSYGHQRQLEVTLALASNPRVLLLDEPAAGLSVGETKGMVELIRSLDPELCLLIIEHDMDVAFEVADEVTVLDHGEILAQGSVEEIRANDAVREVYFGRTHV